MIFIQLSVALTVALLLSLMVIPVSGCENCLLKKPVITPQYPNIIEEGLYRLGGAKILKESMFIKNGFRNRNRILELRMRR